MDPITPGLVEDMNTIRYSGKVNMMSSVGVQSVANDMEMFDLVLWIEDNRRDYMKLLREQANS